jgi:hypothetical protein
MPARRTLHRGHGDTENTEKPAAHRELRVDDVSVRVNPLPRKRKAVALSFETIATASSVGQRGLDFCG